MKYRLRPHPGQRSAPGYGQGPRPESWAPLAASRVLARLASGSAGLTAQEAARRRSVRLGLN